MESDQMSPEQLRKYLAYYRKRVDEEPGDVEARLRLATVYREFGETSPAVEQYENAARLLVDRGLGREAIEACRAILELDPDKVEARYLLARLYAQTPEATEGGARAAEPVESDDEVHELTEEADPRREELIETDEFRPEDEAGEPLSRPDPAEVDRDQEERETRVAGYAESPEQSSTERREEEAEKKTVELTPDERRERLSREEMEELLTTVDVESEDILEVENLDEYELGAGALAREHGEGGEETDFELGAEREVDEPEASGD